MSRQCSYRRQRGAVLPLLAVGMLAIIGVVGISIDVGHVFLNKTRLQNSLDSAALSGARTLMLTESTAAASTDARAVFDDHLNGEMAKLDTGNLVLEYSNTLVPFVAGGSDPRFVRAIYRSFTTNMSFSSVLPNVDESMSIAASAVAGPIPVGYPTGGDTCDIAPLSICGTAVEFNFDDRKKFYFGSNIVSESPEALATTSTEQPPITCEVGSIDCMSIPPDDVYFLLNRVECADDTCIRKSTAGSYSSCLTQNTSIAIEQGATKEPILQGLKTRYGEYHSPLSPAEYPPDVVTNHNNLYMYDNYKTDFASAIISGSSNIGSATNRRVLTVPIVKCEEDAADIKPLLRIRCIFIMDVVEEAEEPYFWGQFIDDCEASGDQGQIVPRMSSDYRGPIEITLYKDPDSSES